MSVPPDRERGVRLEGVPGLVTLLRWDGADEVYRWLSVDLCFREGIGTSRQARSLVPCWGEAPPGYAGRRQVAEHILHLWQIRDSVRMVCGSLPSLHSLPSEDLRAIKHTDQVLAALARRTTDDPDFRDAFLLVCEEYRDGRDCARAALALLEGAQRG